jgi:hypothetical protein
MSPEVLYANFGFPAPLDLPRFSNGSIPFTPYQDQLPGSCRDYYAIDGWAQYRSGEGAWLWVTRDAPLVSPGGPQTLQRRSDAPADPHRIAAVLFDNCWHTNFVADSHGTMEFQFELVWREKIDKPADLAEMLTGEAIAMAKPAWKEPPAVQDNLYRP